MSEQEEGRALQGGRRRTLPWQADCEGSSHIKCRTATVNCENSPYTENCLPWIFDMKKKSFSSINGKAQPSQVDGRCLPFTTVSLEFPLLTRIGKAMNFLIITHKVSLDHYTVLAQSVSFALTQFSSIFMMSEKPVLLSTIYVIYISICTKLKQSSSGNNSHRWSIKPLVLSRLYIYPLLSPSYLSTVSHHHLPNTLHSTPPTGTPARPPLTVFTSPEGWVRELTLGLPGQPARSEWEGA